MSKQKVSKFWSIPVLTIYFYAATILMQYGFISFFNIPSSYLEYSIKDNIIYFFELIKMIISVVSALKWLGISFLLAPSLLIFYLCSTSSRWHNFFKWSAILISILFIIFSYNFGDFIATNSRNLLLVEKGCPSLNNDFRYIVPNIYNGRYILIPIDLENKISGDFIVKESADLNCLVGYKDIGVIKK